MTLIKRKKKVVKIKKYNLLENCPQKKGVVIKTMVITPKKPNSARRSVIKTEISSFKSLFAYIPGIGHNLKKHSLVLISGRGCRDLPGVSYRCIRGKFDLIGVQNRATRRSIYGVKILNELKTRIRRKFRQT
jgi:small subunit ribosomal protein S12